MDTLGNTITVINPDTFIHKKELTFIYLQANNISDIITSSCRGLDQLVHLDLTNNNVEELDPLVFQNTLTSANRQGHEVSKLKHLSIARNKIRSLSFKLFFPLSRNSQTLTPAFEIEYRFISSNRLTTLDVISGMSLNHRIPLTDLTACGIVLVRCYLKCGGHWKPKWHPRCTCRFRAITCRSSIVRRCRFRQP
jgi:Leucine-rich repeat (LRR) protein